MGSYYQYKPLVGSVKGEGDEKSVFLKKIPEKMLPDLLARKSESGIINIGRWKDSSLT